MTETTTLETGTTPDAIDRLAAKRGWTRKALEEVGAESQGDIVRFPMRNGNGKITGYRLRRGDGALFAGGQKANTNTGGRLGLLYSADLTAATITPPLLILEGEPDLCAAYSQRGYQAVALPGAMPGNAVQQDLVELAKRLGCPECVLVPHGDACGEKFLHSVATTLQEIGCEVRFVAPEEGRDLDDRLKASDDSPMLLTQLVDEAIPYRKPTSKGAEIEVAEGGLNIRMFPCTDSGNAELFAARHGDKVRCDHKRGRLLLWTGSVWSADADGEIRRLMLDTVRSRQQLALSLADTALKKKHVDFGISSENHFRLQAALECAKSTKPIADAGEGWDAHPMLLAFNNGTLDLVTGALRESRREDKLTLRIPRDYVPDARAPLWEKFVSEIFCGDLFLIDFAQRAVGLSLTGLTIEQCLFVLYGSGANGKSVFLALLRYILGPFAYNAPFTAFEQHRGGSSGPTNDLAALVDRRLVTASETLEGSKFHEARLKLLSGGDPVTARFLNKEFFEYKPVCKLWLAVNHRPKVLDDSEGFWRRVRLIPFLAHFGPDKADKNLTEKLETEAQGILAWAVQGCLNWQDATRQIEVRGLTPPPAVTTATEEYRQDSDVLGDFIGSCCRVEPGCTVTPSALFAAYKTWADAEGLTDRERLTSTMFGRRIKERFSQGRSGKQRLYVGLTAL